MVVRIQSRGVQQVTMPNYMKTKLHLKNSIPWLYTIILPVVIWGMHQVSGGNFHLVDFVLAWSGAGLFTIFLFLMYRLRQRYAVKMFILEGILLLLAIGIAWLHYATLAAWIGLILFWETLFFFWLKNFLSVLWWRNFLGFGLIATIAGTAPMLTMEVMSHFADEEFFVAVQSIALMVIWGILVIPAVKIIRNLEGFSIQEPRNKIQEIFAFLLFVFIGGFFAIRAYQTSFFPANYDSTFPGISEETPFLCATLSTQPPEFTGPEVFKKIVTLVEANPVKTASEYGMLAITTDKSEWAQEFKTALLQEKRSGDFTHPANSMKSIQYDAAMRAWYYIRVRDKFPNLFSASERSELRRWFAAINKRALTTEWIDWMYGIAFSKIPQGPYENQEVGAGLIAILESAHLADETLSEQNLNYLNNNLRGWWTHFRNIDDAIIYQPQWINNAYFQLLYTGDTIPADKANLSFQWMLLQALPDGMTLGYNYPLQFPLAGSMYFGAELLKNPVFLWMAGREADWLTANNGFLYAQPGLETPIDIQGLPPTQGSCLLYGNSGLPNQLGPLAPDKVVFRGGWAPSDPYLLLNLRFTGWHRYKATNAISLVYRGNPLVQEISRANTISWLPVGRSLLRDKRIPRENVNGLLVEPTGIRKVVHQIVGFGSDWAQDPPQYADVLGFSTSEKADWSFTRLTNWQGWQHDRQIYFYHNAKPIIVWDHATNSKAKNVALNWHLTVGATITTNETRVNFQNTATAQMVILPIVSLEDSPPTITMTNTTDDSNLMITARKSKELQVVSIFLFDNWVDADINYNPDTRSIIIHSTKNGQGMVVRLGEIP